MENAEAGAAFYRARAAEMRAKADDAQSESARESFLTLEASWLRLAEAAERASATNPDPEGDALPSKGLT
jgi:hypothetical protein